MHTREEKMQAFFRFRSLKLNFFVEFRPRSAEKNASISLLSLVETCFFARLTLISQYLM